MSSENFERSQLSDLTSGLFLEAALTKCRCRRYISVTIGLVLLRIHKRECC